jgi:hypothetical protein
VQDLTQEQKIEFTRRVINLLDDWGLDDSDQIRLLGLPEDTRSRQIRKYRNDTPFPDDEKLMERVEHLVGIADALRTSYPTNAAGGTMWMNRRNSRFNDRTPLAAMLGTAYGQLSRFEFIWIVPTTGTPTVNFTANYSA